MNANFPGVKFFRTVSNFKQDVPAVLLFSSSLLKTSTKLLVRGTQSQFSDNICSEDDLRSSIFETFVVNVLACLPLLGFSNIKKMV